RATAMASREPKKVTCTVTQAPSSSRGRSSFMELSDRPRPGRGTASCRTPYARPPPSAPLKKRCRQVKAKRFYSRGSNAVPWHAAKPSGHAGSRVPSGGAELLGRLVGDVRTVEAEGFDRFQVLVAAQPLLQLGIDRITQRLVRGAESQRAVAGVGGVVLEVGGGFDLIAGLLGQAFHGQLGTDRGIGAAGAYGLQLRGGVGHP